MNIKELSFSYTIYHDQVDFHIGRPTYRTYLEYEGGGVWADLRDREGKLLCVNVEEIMTDEDWEALIEYTIGEDKEDRRCGRT